MNPSLNQLCVIQGDYKIDATVQVEADTVDSTADHKRTGPTNTDKKLSALIDNYSLKIKELAADANAEFVLLHSKDGSELCTSILSAYDFDTTLINSSVNTTNGNFVGISKYLLFFLI